MEEVVPLVDEDEEVNPISQVWERNTHSYLPPPPLEWVVEVGCKCRGPGLKKKKKKKIGEGEKIVAKLRMIITIH